MPYVVEFRKGARGDQQEFIKYMNLIREKCFNETPYKPEAEGEVVNEDLESVLGIS
jgi:hypothetical protein